MNHYYQDIPGMMDYEDLYKAMAMFSKSGSHFVELGVWYGRSAAFMAVEIYNSGKDIRFDVIDNFLKSPLDKAWYNLNQFDFINIIQSDTTNAAKNYKDNSIDFVFIDADHSETGVIRDIKAWLPKIKEGGIIAGHDYGNPRYPGVKIAVDSLLNAKQIGVQCWYYVKGINNTFNLN